MFSAALLYVGVVGLIVALGFASVGISYWATKDTIFDSKELFAQAISTMYVEDESKAHPFLLTFLKFPDNIFLWKK